MRSIVSNAIMILTTSGYLYALPELPNNALNPPEGKPKSVARAYCWSLGCTILPFLLPPGGSPVAVVGAFIGPCVGHFYANQWKRQLITIGIRLVSAAACAYSYNKGWSEPSGVSNALFYVGVIGFLGSIGYDVLTIPQSVRKYNMDHGFQIKSETDFQNNRYSFGLVWRFH